MWKSPDSVSKRAQVGQASALVPARSPGFFAHRSCVMLTLRLGTECPRCRLRPGGFQQGFDGTESPKEWRKGISTSRLSSRSALVVAGSAQALPQRAAAGSDPFTFSTQASASVRRPHFQRFRSPARFGLNFRFAVILKRGKREQTVDFPFRRHSSVQCGLPIDREINNRLNILQCS